MYGFLPFSTQPYSALFHVERVPAEIEALVEELISALEPDGDTVFAIVDTWAVAATGLPFAVLDLEQEELVEVSEDLAGAPASERIDQIPAAEDDAETTEEQIEAGEEAQVPPAIRDSDPAMLGEDDPEEEALEPGEEAQLPPAIRDSDPALVGSDEPAEESLGEVEDPFGALRADPEDALPAPLHDEAEEPDVTAAEDADEQAAPAIRDADPEFRQTDEPEEEALEPGEEAAVAPLSLDASMPAAAPEEGSEDLVQELEDLTSALSADADSDARAGALDEAEAAPEHSEDASQAPLQEDEAGSRAIAQADEDQGDQEDTLPEWFVPQTTPDQILAAAVDEAADAGEDEAEAIPAQAPEDGSAVQPSASMLDEVTEGEEGAAAAEEFSFWVNEELPAPPPVSAEPLIFFPSRQRPPRLPKKLRARILLDTLWVEGKLGIERQAKEARGPRVVGGHSVITASPLDAQVRGKVSIARGDQDDLIALGLEDFIDPV